MKTITMSALAVMMAAVTAGAAQAASSVQPGYNNGELKAMIREAHTQEQFQALAVYFHSRQQQFEQKAAEEKVEWDRRSQNVTGPAAKYPRPVDSSRNRYEYFTYEAAQMEQQAAHFESLAAVRR